MFGELANGCLAILMPLARGSGSWLRVELELGHSEMEWSGVEKFQLPREISFRRRVLYKSALYNPPHRFGSYQRCSFGRGHSQCLASMLAAHT